MTARARRGVYSGAGGGCSGPGGYSRVGIPGGNTGYPATTALLEESARYSEAGPGSPARGWSGWYRVLGRTGGGAAPGTTLRARSGASTLPVPGPLGMPPLGQ